MSVNRLGSVIVLATALASPVPAHAWICSRALDNAGEETGPSLSWFTRTITYALHEDGTADIAAKDEMNVMRAAFQKWEGVPPNPLTDVKFVEEAELATRDVVGFDFLRPATNSNVLVFRDAAWLHPGQAASIIALTTTTYSAQTGQILDADIEFNSANFEFTIGDTGVITDLLNTAVHEIGHVLGLGHSTVAGSTMEATAEAQDIEKRTLGPDDLNAIVFKYPAGEPNCYCDEPSCAVDRPECGACSGADCGDWSACGFGAPPRPLENTAAVTVTGFDDGNGGCNCAGTPSAAGVLFLAGAAFCLAWRRGG
ncbi:MAG: matrixin family metalloprotease [Myxococcota bacterium]